MGWTLIHRAFDKRGPYVPTPKVPLADFKKPAKFPTSFENPMGRQNHWP